MNKFSFNTEYIANYALKYNLSEDEVAPQTYGMYWCMFATNTHRLFTKQDMNEFLVRLAITLDTLKIVDNWFAYDKLVPFKIDETYYSLKLEDIYAHLGFEAIDTYKNYFPRDDFLRGIGGGINKAMFIGLLENNFQVIEPQKSSTEEGNYTLDGKQHAPAITTELIQKAEFFAQDVLKFAPKDLFGEIPANRKKKMIELEERRKTVANLPKFSLQMLSEETIEQCMKRIFETEYLEELKQNPEDYKKESYRLLHLAWLFANDLVWGDDYNWNMHEGVELDESEYELEEGGINLYTTYEDYNMEECEEFLKGVGFNKNI